MTDKQEGAPEMTPEESRAEPRVEWDDTKLRSSYANVVNAATTREEVSLFFGTNRTWAPADNNAVKVDLTDRIIMSPFAAKRLMLLLGGVLKEYENRYGQLVVSMSQASPQPGTAPADQDPDPSAAGE